MFGVEDLIVLNYIKEGKKRVKIMLSFVYVPNMELESGFMGVTSN